MLEFSKRTSWTVYRQDDTGNQFVVQSGMSHHAADALVKELESRGHKQHYWAAVEDVPPTDKTDSNNMTSHIADDLIATVEATSRDLRKLSTETIFDRPSPDRWTIKEVIGHLIDSAANNHQRFVRAQFVEELVFPKYEQNEWIACQHYNDVNWVELLDLWVLYNRHLAHVIRNVRPEALAVRCTIGTYQPVTLQFLMEDYVVHLKHHLQKIAERLR